jgi:hypothetical protein
MISFMNSLTPEQQAEVQAEITAAYDRGVASAASGVSSVAQFNQQRKLHCLTMAQTVLLENKRNLPVEQRQITTDEIISLANVLEAHVNG